MRVRVGFRVKVRADVRDGHAVVYLVEDHRTLVLDLGPVRGEAQACE